MEESTKNLIHVNDQNFKTEVIDSDIPVLVDFWAEWCGPCRMLGPTVEALADKYAGLFKIAKINTDEAPTAASLYEVSAIPTVAIFFKGTVVHRSVGVQPREVYERLIETTLH